jgi:hypothetical protein
MIARCLLLWPLLAEPFWNAKPPDKWTEVELQSMFTESPWGRNIGTPLFLASADAMIDAEEEARRRHVARRLSAERAAVEDDWREYLASNRGKHIVVAVRLTNPGVLAEAEESRRMEQECALKVGRKKHRLVGHFPPTSVDPYLRLLFPRAVEASAKGFAVELYLPGVTKPYREVDFKLAEMTYRGRVSY